MTKQAQNLGDALARYELLKKNEHDDGDSSNVYIKEIDLLVREIQDQKKLSFNLPSGECNSTRPFLRENVDFFVKYLFFNEHKRLNREMNDVIAHLNNCYWCFKEYAHIIKAYFFFMQSNDQ